MASKDEKHGASVERHDDGSRTVRTAGGGVLRITPDGRASLDLKSIEAVGIRNVAEVETHQINRVLGSVSHFIRFHGGGEVRFAYNQAGELIEFSAQNVGFSISNDNELVFHKAKKKD